MKRRLDYLLAAGLQVRTPSDDVFKAVRDHARRTGDIDRVSGTDLEVVALAMELEATVLSDDYSIQNLASALKVQFAPMSQTGIKEEFVWELRCTGCGRRFERMMRECPICGCKLRTRRKRPNVHVAHRIDIAEPDLDRP